MLKAGGLSMQEVQGYKIFLTKASVHHEVISNRIPQIYTDTKPLSNSACALFIMLKENIWRMYTDEVIRLVITVYDL